jgi:large subunit ribosomal protein L14
MIQANTHLIVADNSGAKTAKCIKVLGGSFRESAHIGDIIVVAVQQREYEQKFLKRKIYMGLIVGTKKMFRRRAGNYIQFFENRVLLLSDPTKFLSTRVDGPIVTEIRKKKIFKIISLAKAIL